MARPPGPACAGTAKAEGDIAEVGDQPCAVEVLAANVEVAVIATLAAAVDRPAWSERFQCLAPKPFSVPAILVAALCRQCRRHTEAYAQHGGESAGPEFFFLASP